LKNEETPGKRKVEVDKVDKVIEVKPVIFGFDNVKEKEIPEVAKAVEMKSPMFEFS
jgi:hypothetical protein